MNLTNLLRLHAILAAIYGLGLVLAPEFIVSLLSPFPLNPVGADIARLFGAALILVMFVAWGASQLTDRQHLGTARRQLECAGLEYHHFLSDLRAGLWLFPVPQAGVS